MAKDKDEKTAPEAENEDIGAQETSEAPQENEPTAEKTDSVNEEDYKKLEEKCKEMTDKYMRVLAEYDNYRKRTIKEKERIYPEAKAVVVEKFLAVLDNLERALQSAQADDPLYEGVSLVKKQMDDVLTALGVEQIAADGESFDPSVHEAVMHVDDESLGENIIAEEFRKGYKIGDRVVRHSMVKVAN